MKLEDIKPEMRVAYVHWNGEREFGTVSSVNDKFAFVKFDSTVAKLGWDGTTSQSCRPEDLEPT